MKGMIGQKSKISFLRPDFLILIIFEIIKQCLLKMFQQLKNYFPFYLFSYENE